MKVHENSILKWRTCFDKAQKTLSSGDILPREKMFLTEEKKIKLRDFFLDKEQILVVYIFGSQVKERPSCLSDVDIAVYLDERLSKSERFDLRLRLITKACEILGSKEVDLIVLNDALLGLYYTVLKEGMVLYCRDEVKRIDTEVKVMSQYLDQKYYQKRHYEILLQQIRKEGIL